MRTLYWRSILLAAWLLLLAWATLHATPGPPPAYDFRDISAIRANTP
ncbi:MAG: hypothetical protein ABI843_01300 [Dokdonella sp.]